MKTMAIPPALDLSLVSRWPTTLNPATVEAVLARPVDEAVAPATLVTDAEPRASIIVVTCDGLVFTRLCLETLLANLPTDVEVIVIDNASSDGTAEYLRTLSRRDRRIRVEMNARNAGFAAGTNRGAALSRGRVLVFLNNDTIVPRGSLERLVERAEAPEVGVVGAVTNRAGNEAEIEVSYRSYGELQQFADDYAAAHPGELFDIRTATMFCVAIRRDVCKAIGPVDERFEVGLFEDDDYAMRVRQAGYRVTCAEDVFIHHFGQASIGRLGPTGEYGTLFHANRARWEAKWGVEWHSYERRVKPGYRTLIEQLRQDVCAAVPPDATVLVISKGDIDLLKLDARHGWHFPQSGDGAYSGHYPADAAACIAELERLRAAGADYLVVPSTSMWWLDHYREFGQHLQRRYRTVQRRADVGVTFELRSTGSV